MKKIALALVMTCMLALSLAAIGCSGQAEPAKDESKDLVVSNESSENEPFYVLLVGNDTRLGTAGITEAGYEDGNARSDTMMLVRVNPKTYTVTLITVPRDTATQLNGSTAKINETYHQTGINGAVSAVEELTGTNIRYYLDINFVNFEKLIDALGGVTTNVPINLSLADIVSGNNINLQPGEQQLDGAEALVLARARKDYSADQDANRQIQDRNIVMALIEQVASASGAVESAVDALYSNVDTNWNKAEMTSLVKDFADHASSMKIYSCTGPYTGGTDPSAGVWVATRDEGTWQRIINTANDDKDPSGIVPLPASY